MRYFISFNEVNEFSISPYVSNIIIEINGKIENIEQIRQLENHIKTNRQSLKVIILNYKEIEVTETKEDKKDG